jgi:hypothetical protein
MVPAPFLTAVYGSHVPSPPSSTGRSILDQALGVASAIEALESIGNTDRATATRRLEAAGVSVRPGTVTRHLLDVSTPAPGDLAIGAAKSRWVEPNYSQIEQRIAAQAIGEPLDALVRMIDMGIVSRRTVAEHLGLPALPDPTPRRTAPSSSWEPTPGGAAIPYRAETRIRFRPGQTQGQRSDQTHGQCTLCMQRTRVYSIPRFRERTFCAPCRDRISAEIEMRPRLGEPVRGTPGPNPCGEQSLPVSGASELAVPDPPKKSVWEWLRDPAL